MSLVLGARKRNTFTPWSSSKVHGTLISDDRIITTISCPCLANSMDKSRNCTAPEDLNGGNTSAIKAMRIRTYELIFLPNDSINVIRITVDDTNNFIGNVGHTIVSN